MTAEKPWPTPKTAGEWVSNELQQGFEAVRFQYGFPVVLGRPQATAAHTVEELEIMGMAGVYRAGPDFLKEG